MPGEDPNLPFPTERSRSGAARWGFSRCSWELPVPLPAPAVPGEAPWCPAGAERGLSSSPEFIVIHNGIITNYKDLRKFLVSPPARPHSGPAHGPTHGPTRTRTLTVPPPLLHSHSRSLTPPIRSPPVVPSRFALALLTLTLLLTFWHCHPPFPPCLTHTHPPTPQLTLLPPLHHPPLTLTFPLALLRYPHSSLTLPHPSHAPPLTPPLTLHSHSPTCTCFPKLPPPTHTQTPPHTPPLTLALFPLPHLS